MFNNTHSEPAVGDSKPGTAPVGFGQNGWNQAGSLFGSSKEVNLLIVAYTFYSYNH